MTPATINEINEKINKLTLTLRADRKSSSLNRTETNLLGVHERIGDILDGELTEWQTNVVIDWFLDKGTTTKIKRNSAERQGRAKRRFERALEYINEVKVLLGVQTN